MRIAKRIGLTIIIPFSLVCAGGLTACQGNTPLVEEKSPFGTNVARLGDTVVAEVDGTSIYISDIEHAALAKGAIKPGTPLTPANPIFQTVLDELIDQRLLAFEALRRSFDKNTETQRRLSTARERILSNVVIENLMSEKVTEEAIRKIYDAQTAQQTGGKQVRSLHIQLATEEKAIEIASLLESGGDFSALAKEFSMDQNSRDLGGDTRWFSRDALREDMAEIAFATPIGEVSAPFQNDLGWHLMKTIGRRSTPVPRYEDIKPEITSYMTYDEIEKLLKSLRTNSDISLKLGGGQTPTEATPTEAETPVEPKQD